MAAYLILNLVVLLSIYLGIRRIGAPRPTRRILPALAALLVLTIIFDSIAIGLGLFGYNPERILGWYILKAPIEDLAYTIGAVLLVPAVWYLLGRKESS